MKIGTFLYGKCYADGKLIYRQNSHEGTDILLSKMAPMFLAEMDGSFPKRSGGRDVIEQFLE